MSNAASDGVDGQKIGCIAMAVIFVLVGLLPLGSTAGNIPGILFWVVGFVVIKSIWDNNSQPASRMYSTRRPMNQCANCGYTWHPRGHDLSTRCPNCGSR
jgi:hypothetical protein